MKARRYLWLVMVMLVSSLTLWLGGQSGRAVASGDTVGVALERGTPINDTLRRAHRLIDYGSFVWAILPADDAPAGATDYALTLGGAVVNLPAARALPAAWAATAGSGPDLHLVQFVGPTRAEWLDQLTANGLDVVQYIHPFTYLVWGTGEQVAAAVGRTAMIRWSGPFAPAYRVLPEYRAPSQDNGATTVYNTLVYRGADLTRLAAALATPGDAPVRFVPLNATWAIAQVALDDAELLAAARLPGLYSLQPLPRDGGLRSEQSNQILAGKVSGGVAVPGYLAWLSSVGLDGSGVTIGHVDDGVQEQHPDLQGRVLPSADCVGSTCSLGSATHGTHTAGIVAGTGASGSLDAAGFLRGLGVAPGADLVEQRYYPTYTYAGGMTTLMRDSYANGAQLSTNSWGPSGSARGYDADTLQVDIGVRDVATAPGNQPFGYILSFMNGYGGASTQGSPDEAKNAFTTGSTWALNAAGGQTLALDDLSVNSAHGPALDGRRIPHIVAPGCRVDSTIPGATPTTASYGLLCGTSMAAPHLAGAVALFIEQQRALTGRDPSPALIKAAFAAVADSLVGRADADGFTLGLPPDSKQGWGRLNLAAVISPTLTPIFFDQAHLLSATGDEWTLTVAPIDSSAPMRLMLVWTDAPGHGLGGSTPAWNNDLDLIVQRAGATYRGNVFGGDGFSLPAAPAAERDQRNNMEGVFLPAAADPLAIVVRAANLTSDGVPNNLHAIDQDFALACYNCIEIQPTVTPTVTLAKLASAEQVAAGAVLTYTLRQTVTLPGVHALRVIMTDTLPAGMELITETLRLGGQPVTADYDRASGRFVLQTDALLDETLTIEITYRARYAVPLSTLATLTNTVESATIVRGMVQIHTADVAVATTWGPGRIFLPVVRYNPTP